MDLNAINIINKQEIKSAGARYTPGIDPDAPNLEIASLVHAFDALARSDSFRTKLVSLGDELRESWNEAPDLATKAFARLIQTPDRVIELLNEITNQAPGESEKNTIQLSRTVAFVGSKTDQIMNSLWQEERDLEGKKEHSEELSRIRHRIRLLSNLIGAIASIGEYIDSPAFRLINENRLFLTGDWGTGKTHFLCDNTNYRMQQALPTLFVLAHHIPAGDDPLTKMCRSKNLADNKESMLNMLQRAGKALSQRSLIFIDGINEGDRDSWRKALATLGEEIKKYPNVGLVVSCRRPYDEILLGKRAKKRFITVVHPGFEEVEFDAQAQFFEYYNIPTPKLPLLTPEFTRPLFLKLFCLALKDLSISTKRRKIGEIVSGQKGMTYLLEYFVNQIGKKIECDYGFTPKSCWRLLKGATRPRNEGEQGIAGMMARGERDYVTYNECSQVVSSLTHLSSQRKIREFIQHLVAEGLLVDDLAWANGWNDVIRLPYQRFSDHLIARHLLSQYLNTDSEASIRRSFYRNKPLGRIFETDRFGAQYAKPDLATAIMLEFPEWVKRTLHNQERELVYYLPRRLRLVTPLRNAFLEGLVWRSRDSFTKQTDHVVAFLLDRGSQGTKERILEVIALLATRINHPYSSMRLYRYLSKLQMCDRDLIWSEFLRKAQPESVIHRTLKWINHIQKGGLGGEATENLIRLLCPMLTTTHRRLRDEVTKALYLLGLEYPKELFELTIESFAFNDPYVPERMLAAAYGVAMNSWADKENSKFRNAIGVFAKRLYMKMFAPNAPFGTRHILTRDYALGIVDLTRKIEPQCIANQYVQYTRPPFNHLPTPFPDGVSINEAECEPASDAILMDFENYTVGGLVRDRRNYDMQHVEYRVALRQIKWRILNLGYDPKRFKEVDREVASDDYRRTGRGGNGTKIDRYGKKYSWIAYFELYGLRQDQGVLPEHRMDERTSDCDIDPSFPPAPHQWCPTLPDLFTDPYNDPRGWLRNGPNPDYQHLLVRVEVDKVKGPWILLNGFITQGNADDPRKVFTFMRALFLKPRDFQKLRAKLAETAYPGNMTIPEPGSDYYTFAGEIPWSCRYGQYLRDDRCRAKRHTDEMFDQHVSHRIKKPIEEAEESEIASAAVQEMLSRIRGNHLDRQGESKSDRREDDEDPHRQGFIYATEWEHMPGIRVEIPVHTYSWESYHSELNQVGGIDYPSPALCEKLGLVNRYDTLDLYDENAIQATIYREYVDEPYVDGLHLLYLRQDLLELYLEATQQIMVWINWGERDFHREEINMLQDVVQDVWASNAHIHKTLIPFQESMTTSVVR